MTLHEYEIGIHKNEIDTPALLVDVAAMERNLEKMAEYFRHVDAKLRPHVKLHKATPILAHKQLCSGGVGLTCAKLAEAEILAQAGIKDILIANEVVGARKMQRLVNLAAYTNLIVAVDSLQSVTEISNAAQQRNVKVGVLVEVDIGNNRCGVDPFGPALELSRAVAKAPGIIYKGIMGYDGHCTFQVQASERAECARKANQLLVDTRDFIEKAGLPIQIVSGSGTFTYKMATTMKGLTEVQAGTYLLMDTAFKEKGVEEFDCTLTILATVISRPIRGANDMAILDVGRKQLDPIYGFPEVKVPSDGEIYSMPQEHSRLRLKGNASSIRIGDKVELWVRDANGTINLFDKFYAIRDDHVEAIWDIPGRGQAT
jgi:D-serine deaminase-like pyridoxal phosphate-dependent protein